MAVVRCKSATAFLNLLHQAQVIRSSELKYDDRCSSEQRALLENAWYFRGQAQAYEGLVPSLFRPSSGVKHGEWREFESAMLTTLRAKLAQRSAIAERLLEDAKYLMALAQHYGCPTRMLDWSLNPLVAAYFAASEAIREDVDSETPLVVYAVSPQGLHDKHIGGSFDLVPLRGENENLFAQNGVMILHDWDCRDLWHADYELPVAEDDVPRRPNLRFELPVRFADELLKELAARGVDGVSLFPGQHGFVRAARDCAMSDVSQLRGSMNGKNAVAALRKSAPPAANNEPLTPNVEVRYDGQIATLRPHRA